MPSLSALVFTALTALVRPSTHWSPVPPDRIALIAEDVALAVEFHDGAPFRGPRRLERAGLALAAIAIHESNLAVKVASCAYAGDPLRGWKPGRGRSITVYQLMQGVSWAGHTRAEICESGPLAAYLAASVLARYRRAPTALGAFQGYASGDSGRRSKAASRQCQMWERAARGAGLRVSCEAPL